jgi:hypothetical protein
MFSRRAQVCTRFEDNFHCQRSGGKSKTRPKIIGFIGEGSNTKTFEHLENFASP